MLDSITAFLKRIWSAITRWLGLVFVGLAWPFLAARGWYRHSNWLIKLPVAAFVVLLAVLYIYFVWQTQIWTGFNPAYPDVYKFSERKFSAGEELPATQGQQAAAAAPKACQTSAVVDVAADLTDFDVNQNAWISSMMLYKLGFFGISWDDTPFLDNKASFQRGINSVVRRTSAELVDTLGRVRGTSSINSDLQKARGNLQFDESSWYFGLHPFGPKTPTPSYYRAAITNLRNFNTDLSNCKAVFDGRADNLLQFVDHVAGDLGSTANILADRSQNYSYGWFDMRADDRFWFAYGQLYANYGILSAAGADFQQVIAERNVGRLWNDTLGMLQTALRIQPMIISNGREDSSFMPSHLATMGFHILRVRSNLVEIRTVLGGR
ncbi:MULTISPECIES: DUF2333 family protein [unclassified Rhizobium]|uniref:DUF2333 family protein n=1 Tax=unclassified Rhizobium TaxID=2613769 RepID=UPI000EAA4B2D|nr:MULTISPECIES: DUF2333 family protein [unclassified Rhizobium]AYG66901.1 DUF2333 family protein [Rhizobium sp. CCGE531]AYG73281.1 DUF2333 family protein [Rhizobium sp. CCGE532]